MRGYEGGVRGGEVEGARGDVETAEGGGYAGVGGWEGDV